MLLAQGELVVLLLPHVHDGKQRQHSACWSTAPSLCTVASSKCAVLSHIIHETGQCSAVFLHSTDGTNGKAHAQAK